MEFFTLFVAWITEAVQAHPAEFVALVTAAFVAYQGIVLRQHNRLSVTPALSSHTGKHAGTDRNRLTFTLSNNGVGPAVIREFFLFKEGELVEASESDHIIQCLSPVLDSIKGVRIDNAGLLTPGYFMPAGEKFDFLTISVPADRNPELIRNALESMDIAIRYRCIYGRRYSFDSRSPFHQLLSRRVGIKIGIRLWKLLEPVRHRLGRKGHLGPN